MKVINLTPHNVDICDKNGKIIKTYERSGKIARLVIEYEQIEDVDGIPVTVRQISRVVNLPEPEEGVMYIVSNYVLDYCNERTDLLAPVQQVKIYNKVVGCRSFMSNKGRS